MIKRSTLLDLCFAGAMFIVFSNLNGIASILFNITAAFSIFILAFCLVIIYYLYDYKKITFPHYAFNATIILFLGIGAISWLFFSYYIDPNINKTSFYKIFRKTFPSLILTYAVYKYLIYANDRGKLTNVLYFITFSLLFVSLIIPVNSIFDFIDISFSKGGKSRGSGFFVDPNIAGVHSNLTLCFVLFFIINSKRFSLLFLGFVPLALYSAFLTFSKAAIIGGILIVLIFFLLNLLNITRMLRARRRRFGKAFVIIIIGLIAAMPSIMKYASELNHSQLRRLEQVGKLATGQFDKETTTDRSALWQEAVDLIATKPITGYGLTSFHYLPKGRLGTHNTFLLVWGEAGVFAFAALLIFIFSVYYRAIFWVRDPSYRFLIITVFFTISVQFYMSGHTGLSNSEACSMIGVIFALLKTQQGNIDHLKHGKYVGVDYKMKARIYE